MGSINEKSAWALLRIIMGWLMLWPFMDKLLGLGYSTCFDAKTGNIDLFCSKAWLFGGNPTYGYLTNAVHGPFKPVLNAMADSSIVTWLFMLGLAGIGIALILGAAVRPASFFGVIMMLLLLSGGYDFSKNPILDTHMIEGAVFFGLMFSHAGQYFGLGKWWVNTRLVQKYPILE